MESTIKETVKNIFKTHTFDDAVNDPAFVTKTKSKDICDFVLNYDSNK